MYTCIYNKTNIKRNILTIKQNTSGRKQATATEDFEFHISYL